MRFDVLDKGFVELVDYMGDENAVVDAARVSYDRRADQFTEEKNDRLLNYLIEHNHGTPFEMVVFKFRVKAPVVVWWHWVRHRMASYNLQSGRYTPYTEEVYLPASWRTQSKTNKQGSLGVIDGKPALLFDALRDELHRQAFALYQQMLDMGVAKEQARLVLPGFALYHEGIVQMNLRSLMNFLALREGDDAQSEIRQYADAIRRIVEKTHPKLLRSA